MQIPISWINQFVETESIELNALIEKLTLGGFEVEEILELEINDRKEIVLDISATANRSDSLSIQGIGKEIATLLNQSTIISNYSLPLPLINWKKLLEKENNIQSIETSNDCLMFIGLTIENITNFSVPKWISQKLLSSGIVLSNNLLDFQNYILLETGYPFAFYDLDKIKAKTKKTDFKLSIAPATEKQTFRGKDNLKYELDKSILTVNVNEFPISIAGILESEDVFYSNETKALLIEASIFKAAKIRQQSRKLGVRTDRSARYEKSLKSTYLLESLYRLILLLRISNPNLKCKLQTIYRIVEPTPKKILLRYQTIQEILGPINKNNSSQDGFIKPQKISDYLTRLNFKFTFDEINLRWKVQVPNFRTEDVSREIDLIEEIARLEGFNHFLTQLPKIKRIGNKDSNYKTRKKITTCLLNLGFNELIHYSLVNETTFLENEIQLINPLVADYSSLRSTLLPNLIKTFQENFKQKNKLIEGFEYGHIFLRDRLTNFQEKDYVAGIFGGSQIKTSWSDSGDQPDWFTAKGKIEQFFEQLNLVTYWKSSTGKYVRTILHPYRTAEVYLSNNSFLGTFGQINPILANQLNIPSKIYLFEFNIELINEQLQRNNLIFYKQYSLYPKIIKDLSFIIQKDVEFEQVQQLLYLNGTEFLSEINLLDEYRGPSIPENHISLCLQLIFQSPTRTLENKEIEVILKNLELILTTQYNAIIRQ